MTTLEGRLAQLKELRELRSRFDQHVENEERPLRRALVRLLDEHHALGRCCAHATAAFTPEIKIVNALDCMYAEWTCAVHGSGSGVYIRVELIAKELGS